MQSLNVRKKRGFSLIELLVAIAIIAILIALLLPAVQQARVAARRIQCKNNLKLIALALHSYHELHSMFPQGQVFRGPPDGTSDAPGWSWSSMILPMIDQAPLYNKFNFSLPLHDPSHSQFLSTNLETFLCPSDASAEPQVEIFGGGSWSTRSLGVTLASSTYCANAGSFELSLFGGTGPSLSNGVMYRDSTISFSDITDGTSNTILMGEATHIQSFWDPNLYGRWISETGTAGTTKHAVRQGFRRMNPLSIAAEEVKIDAFSSFHEGGVYFALVDGSVRFISERIDHTQRPFNNLTMDDPFDLNNNGAAYGTYQRLFSRNDGLSVGAF